MTDPERRQGFVDRVSRRGEGALAKVAEELVANPVVAGAVARAFGAREKAAQAQEVAMGALNIPSAADVERVTRRLRSLSQRLEGVEDVLDGLEEQLAAAAERAGEDATGRLEQRLEEIAADLAVVRDAVAPAQGPPPPAQEPLSVSES